MKTGTQEPKRIGKVSDLEGVKFGDRVIISTDTIKDDSYFFDEIHDYQTIGTKRLVVFRDMIGIDVVQLSFHINSDGTISSYSIFNTGRNISLEVREKYLQVIQGGQR